MRVQVVDVRGAPVADVPVVLAVREKDGSEEPGPRATTDPAGEARFPHPRDSLRSKDELLARIAGALSPAVEAPLDLEHEGSAARLVLPACGALDVALVHADGTRERTPHALSVDWGGPGVAGRTPSLHLLAQEGAARVFPVGLGLELRLSAMTLAEHDVGRSRVRGPTRADETVTARIEVTEPPVLLARLVDPQLRPLARATLEVRILPGPDAAGGDHALEERRVRTDGEGRLRLELDPKADTGAARMGLATPADATEPALSAELTLPTHLPPGDTNLGDIVLAAGPLLAAGVVLDEDGEPRAGASGSADYRPPEDDGERWLRATPELATTTDEEGRFALRGRVACGRLRIWCFARDAILAEPVEVPPGARGVRLVLRRTGTLAARVLVDPALRSDVVVDLARGRVARFSTRSPGPDGGLRFVGLLPGTYGIAVRLKKEAELVAERPSVQIVPGETTDAGDFDLRGRLHELAFTVTDEEGRALQAEATGQDVDGDGVRGDTWCTPEGRAAFVTARGALDVRISCAGHRTVERNVVDGETVVLPRGLPVVVRLRGGLPPLTPDESLTIDMVELPSAASQATADLDPGGIAELAVAEPGEYRVLLVFVSSSAPPGHPILLESHCRVVEDEETRVELVLDPAALTVARAGGR